LTQSRDPPTAIRGLDDWLRWQEGLHPSKIELGLERVAEVWGRLGPAQLPFPVITIAGTNGKGSCAAMLEAIYRAAGYRTACYTSPHLLRYNERVRLDGQEVADAALCSAFERVDVARGATTLTYFEFGTLAAVDIFVRAAPDIAILEVGLGGRLDAVNLFDPDVAVITAIGRDHTAWLGETLGEIAREKAGILRTRRPAVIGHREPAPTLIERAEELGSRLLVLGRDFDWERESVGWRWKGPAPLAGLPPPALRGGFQYDNAAAAIMAVSCLSERLPVAVGNLRQGLQRVRLPGRFQVLPGEPSWILDVAHNAQAAESLAQNLAAFDCRGRLIAVLGVLRDKEPAAVAAPLAERVAAWHLGQASDPRALSAEELGDALAGLALGAEVHPHAAIEAALAAAERSAGPGDCILAFGSFTTVEAALRYRVDCGLRIADCGF
jgi:dihydrofolate synthase/folylpolyglutamate synthase